MMRLTHPVRDEECDHVVVVMLSAKVLTENQFKKNTVFVFSFLGSLFVSQSISTNDNYRVTPVVV